MAKKDNHEDPFTQMMNEMKNMFKSMTEEQREQLGRLITDETYLIELENSRFYRYQKPDYHSKSIREIRWLAPFWNAQQEDDKVMLCRFVEKDIRRLGLTREAIKEEMRGYLYKVFADFNPHQHDNHWRLYGPFWMMERLQMTDCLDLVLESLRQDAYFFHNYFLRFSEWISAVVYQLGKNQIDTLEQFLYEQGIMPDAKPIVFNAIVWIYLRHPEKRLRITAVVVKFLNHCLEICQKGASSFNIESYAISCATAKMKETLPALRKLFTELDLSTHILVEGFDELEQEMTNREFHFCCMYDNMNDYLYDEKECYALDDADWEDSGEEDDDFYDDDDSIFNDGEKAKRYTIRIELLDAPEKVERTLQVPSNIYLAFFTEVLMLSFGRHDIPEQYEFSVGDMRYRPDVDDFALEEEYWDMDDSYYATLNDLLSKKGNTATFNIMKGDKNIWRHVLTLEKSGRYTEKTENYINLIKGQGSYPAKSIKNMNAYIARYHANKVRKPNFDTIRKLIRDFEEDNSMIF